MPVQMVSSSKSQRALEESQRLMREREQDQAALEERLKDSRKNLARSDELLARLKKIFSRG